MPSNQGTDSDFIPHCRIAPFAMRAGGAQTGKNPAKGPGFEGAGEAAQARGLRARSSSSSTSNTAPQLIPTSAKLKAGKYHSRQ